MHPDSLTARSRGYSLVELMVAIGLFAFVVAMATGAYLMMINANREAQAITTGINNLSYALESMTRNIRTGRSYNCLSATSFSFSDDSSPSRVITYSLSGNAIQQQIGTGSIVALTDPAVTVNVLKFTCFGVAPGASDPRGQASVTIVVSGTVNAGAGKERPFNIQTGATMRGTDL